MRIAPLLLLTFLCTSGPAAQDRARPEPPSHGLATARTIFARSDVDRNGRISQGEARGMGVSPRSWAIFDADGDGSVGFEEFLLGYRRYVIGAGHRVAPDFELEATRLEALRRARLAAEQRPRERTGPSAIRRWAGTVGSPSAVRTPAARP